MSFFIATTWREPRRCVECSFKGGKEREEGKKFCKSAANSLKQTKKNVALLSFLRLAFELFPGVNAANSSLGTANNDASTSIAGQQRKLRTRRGRDGAVENQRFVVGRRRLRRKTTTTTTRFFFSRAPSPSFRHGLPNERFGFQRTGCVLREGAALRARPERALCILKTRPRGDRTSFFFFERGVKSGGAEEGERQKGEKNFRPRRLKGLFPEKLSSIFLILPAFTTKRAARCDDRRDGRETRRTTNKER